jgi:NADH-quinone oxidoreductase subunit N
MERVLAVLMSTFMLSLLGLPLTAGFMGKFQIFYAALDAGWVWLTVIAALNSVISLFYYLRVIVHMYMKPVSTAPEASQPAPSVSSLLALTGLVGTAVGIIYLGIFPNDFLQLTQLSVTGISY